VLHFYAKNKILNDRASFASQQIEALKKEALEAKIAEIDGAFKELKKKTEVTSEQAALIGGVCGVLGDNSDENALRLSSYKIDVDQELIFSKKLGAGAFGIVYKAEFNGEDVAVKQVIAENVNQDSLKRFVGEIQLMSNLHHPNVVQMLACAWEAPNLAIVLEYAKNGDLGMMLKKHNSRLTWRARRLRWVRNICHGVSYLHQRSPPVMHRDLKLENCLVTEYNVCKLSDFGESKVVSSFEEDQTIVGTPYYMAPEILKGDAYNESCDVFSFGIALASIGIVDGNAKHVFSPELRAGKRLTQIQKKRLGGMSICNKHAKGWRADLSSFVDEGKWPEEMKNLIERCWREDRTARPTMKEASDEIEKWTPTMFNEGLANGLYTDRALE
jgi:serine/threonine protein kinase